MTEDTKPLSQKVAIISIVAFWALYFAVLSMRAAVIYRDNSHLGNRLVVSIASIGITYIVYLLLRLVPISRLGRAITVAALLAVPGTIAYATINYYVFLPTKQAHQKAKPPQDEQEEVTDLRMGKRKIILPDGSEIEVPVARPHPPTTITVGTMGNDEEDMTPIQEIADQAANGYFFFCSWAALYLALCYAGEVGRLARRTAKLEAAARSAELRALRYQVNPHFLFNTLNSLSSLVLTGKRDAAEQMILNLSTFFRTSLTGDPTEDVRLGEEIQLQRLYLEIEAVRFPERLKVSIEVPAYLERACVPGLILQPLVENAVKYGVSRARRPVTIRIAATEEAGLLVLRVEDDGDALIEKEDGGTGVGLANVRDRMIARYGDAGSSRWGQLSSGGFAVALRMPLVTDDC